MNTHHQPARPAQAQSRGRRAVSRVTAAILAGLTAVGMAMAGGPPSAQADVPLLRTGDILVTTFGDAFSGAGVDRLNAVNGEIERFASFGVNNRIDHVAAAPNGNVFVTNREGDIFKVDGFTGDQTQIRNGSNSFFEFDDLVVGRDGNLVAVLVGTTGPSLVRINSSTGQLTKLANGDLLPTGGSIAIEHDGRVLVTDDHQVIRIDPVTGNQTVVREFAQRVRGVAVRNDGAILVRTKGEGTVKPKLVKVDPFTHVATTISIGGFLSATSGSAGLAMEDGIFVVSAENGSAESVVRINTFTGKQEQLLRRGVTEVNDVTVFGVQQIPPPPPPVAVSDTFTMAQQDGQLHVTAPGILANDTDPLGQPLKAELVGSPQLEHGFISFFGDGEFFYFPNSDFVGTEIFAYRVVAGGRTSKTVTVSMQVTPAPLPLARADNFFLVGKAGARLKGNVLRNDVDPLGKPLTALRVGVPAHGTATLNPGGAFVYRPAPGFVGIDSFRYQAVAADGRHSAVTIVSVQVTPPPGKTHPRQSERT